MKFEEIKSYPVFSVIIPVYNKEENVERAIASVFNQTFDNFEVIVICDPSTDKSDQEVLKFSDDRLRIFYRNEPGPGGYAARNLGIKNARGKWITFLDADDEWFPNRLLSHKKIFDQHDCDIICSSWQDVYDDGTKSEPLPLRAGMLTAHQFFRLYGKSTRVIHTNTITCKKKIFNAVGGFPVGRYKRGGDVYTWLKIVDFSGFVFRSTEEVSIYHKEASTVTKNHRPDLEGNAVYDMCKALTEKNGKSFLYNYNLYVISNRHIRYGLVDRVKSGSFKLSDLQLYRFWVNPIDYARFLVVGMLPESLRIRVVGWIRSTSKLGVKE
uniref:glycosyltransferase family A protein n=1 Tax=uncultured Halomonas sp. TaxID=173971 RepID=UPI0026258327|nr:glycosyltransferase family 2 protein [uncultured Halomonas sp.]